MASNGGPDFSTPVQQDGYAWWYVDGFSDDARHGLTMIAFVGSVFSPYYAAARRRGPADPEHFCALNVALYGRGGKRWALTERGRGDLQRNADTFRVGPSQLTWDGTSLIARIDETTVPLPRRLRGTVRVFPLTTIAQTFTLSDNGQHRWRPIAPACRIEVEMQNPALSWSGHGYLDCNTGETPVESAFRDWDWSRVAGHDDTVIFYDGIRRGGEPFNLALAIGHDGVVRDIDDAPGRAKLAPTPVWRIPRVIRSDIDAPPSVLLTCEDTPFYARSQVALRYRGETRQGMHESLLLDRFASRWVQTLLPFRMPRIAKDSSSAAGG